MKLNELIMVAACTLAVTSCSQSGDTQNAQIAFDTYTGMSAYTLEGSAADFMQDSDVVYADSVSLMLPIRLGDCDLQPLRDSICEFALGIEGRPIVPTINQWMHENAQKQGYPAKKYENPNAADIVQGFDFINGFIVNLTPDLMVYCVRTDSYQAGAAHGMSTRRYINFSLLGNGRVVNLSELFTPAGLKALPGRIADQAQAMSDIIGATTVTDLPENGNFYISSEGEIVFSYQPYEIASYAQGTIDIPFYPYELVDDMTPYALDLFNLQDLGE